MNAEYLAGYILPYLLWFAIAIGFLAALTVGLGLAMSLVYLQAMTSTLKKFNANMDEAHANFAKLNASTQQQLIAQTRAAEIWRRTRKEQLDEQETEHANGKTPSFTQDWRAR